MNYYLQIKLQDNVLHELGTNESRLRALTPRLDEFDLLRDLKYFKPKKKDRFVPFSQWSEIKQAPRDYVHIANSETPERATKSLELNILFDKISLEVATTDQGRESYQQLKDNLERFCSLTVECAIALGAWSGIRVLGVKYKYPQPPRSMVSIPDDAVLDVINTRPARPMAELARLLDALRAEPPRNASVKSLGAHMIVDWLNRPSAEPNRVAEAMSSRLSWYYEHVPFQRMEDYNELGDEMVLLFKPAKDPFYTFYFPFSGSAYKALVDLPEDLQQDESIASMLRDMKKGKTKGGRRLSSVTLIVPSREQAMKLRERAQALGFAGTAYPDKGSLWSPHSDGE
ncbi:hypothetical protein [Corallococcus exiguus]|uniref:Uncharacterized protein n=1 Tax=Corallococcus exiguus TaxID=83462 RepID=A0A7X5BXN8_9BACT|nr:hypothetical protein [Corallococcus exiguus]NBC45343.1 hypothetical protein [Corallococcus exiguus]TNV63066.1 hypothetical protein FH620_16235 [Corallococcus exiguus]